jgi:Tol biopolymer transport system component
MKNTLIIRLLQFIIIISLVSSIFPGYRQNISVEAREAGNVRINKPTLFSSSPTGKIVFSSDRSGNDEIYTMNANGSNVHQITYNSGPDTKPSWSPDGSKIAFESTRDGWDNIYTMNNDGTEIVKLTNSHYDSFPVWSPDGNQIAFSSARETSPNGSRSSEVWVMNSDGTGQKRLTDLSAPCLSPAWSPDSTHIVYVCDAYKNSGIYIMDSDGSNPIKISSIGNSPRWSPDGLKIVFEYNWDIYVMESDGTKQTRLTNDTIENYSPRWSPDGMRIIFTSWRDINHEIYIMDANGNNQTRITNNPARDGEADWIASNLPEITVNTLEATDVTVDSARLNGELADLNGEVGANMSFEYGSVSGSYSDETSVLEKNSVGTFSFPITGLGWGTEYYYVAKAVVGNDTIYGQEKCFKTSFQDTLGKITFTASNGLGTDPIFIMNPDGTEKVKLTSTEAINEESAISPDGNKIAFCSYTGNHQIYVMNKDGSNQTRLISGSSPNWSPDGAKIAFQSDSTSGNDEIYSMNADGSNPVCLTNSLGIDTDPCWSPDGRKIAFSSKRSGTNNEYDIFIMNADGTDVKQITTDPDRDIEPDWSPDGNKILFTSWRNIDTEVFVMDADGKNQIRLASGASPCWSPDGTKITYIGWYYGNPRIFIMNADGSNQAQITDIIGTNASPCWGVSDATAPVLGDVRSNNLGTNSAVLKGSLKSVGSAKDTYILFEWGMSPNTYTHQTLPFIKSDLGDFSYLLTNLDPGTTYYFRSKAYRQGNSYSLEGSFKTKNLKQVRALRNGKIGVEYSSTTISAFIGTPPYTWSLEEGDILPPGLLLDPSTGVISGIPINNCNFTFCEYVTDSAEPNRSESAILSIEIKKAFSGGGGGGGGGGGSSSKITQVDTTGLKITTGLYIDKSGFVQDDVNVSIENGNIDLGIKKNTKITNAAGNPLDKISIKKLDPLNEVVDNKTILQVYEFGPDGASFDPPLTLIMLYNTQTLMAGSKLEVSYWNGVEWVSIDSQIDEIDGKIISQINHFSKYALLMEAPPAKFEISALKIFPEKVNINDAVTVVAEVTNNGGSEGLYVLVLKINDQMTESKQVTLKMNTSQKVIFELNRNTPGEYIVDLNGAKAQFTIMSHLPPTPEKTISQPVLTTSTILHSSSISSTPSANKGKSISIFWIVLALIIIFGLIILNVYFYRRAKRNKN